MVGVKEKIYMKKAALKGGSFVSSIEKRPHALTSNAKSNGEYFAGNHFPLSIKCAEIANSQNEKAKFSLELPEDNDDWQHKHFMYFGELIDENAPGISYMDILEKLWGFTIQCCFQVFL